MRWTGECTSAVLTVHTSMAAPCTHIRKLWSHFSLLCTCPEGGKFIFLFCDTFGKKILDYLRSRTYLHNCITGTSFSSSWKNWREGRLWHMSSPRSQFLCFKWHTRVKGLSFRDLVFILKQGNVFHVIGASMKFSLPTSLFWKCKERYMCDLFK